MVLTQLVAQREKRGIDPIWYTIGWGGPY
jgi:hypothetical protein